MSDTPERSESGSPIYRHKARERGFEPAFGDPDALRLLEEHVERHVGKVATVFHELLSDLVHVDLHIVEPTPERDFYTILTTGMSDQPMNAPEGAEEYRYGEMMICLPPEWPMSQEAWKDERNYWPMRWLKILARFPHEYDTWLSYLHTIPNGDPPEPYSDNTELCCAMLLMPLLFGEEFRQLRISDEKTIVFYSLVPLYREEMEFKLKHGADPLLDRFEEHEICELLDLQRPNVCLD